MLDDGPPIAVFDYQASRAGAHARAFLHGWRGHLMVDDDVGYQSMFTDGPTEFACLAHIRRKFFEVHAASASPVAEEALRRIAGPSRATVCWRCYNAPSPAILSGPLHRR